MGSIASTDVQGTGGPEPGLLDPSLPRQAWARDLTKIYGSGQWQVIALDHVDVDFQTGRFTAIMGPSGSGKSTLMHCMAGLDRITSGRVAVGDRELNGMRQRDLTRLRRTEVGFIFQSFNLIPTLTARENIVLPLDIAHRSVDRDWFDEVVRTVGLTDRLTHRPDELSGGQQQRVACARALVSRPAIIFADEPTGNLDSHSAKEMLSLLRRCVDDLGQTVVMVTHDPTAASYAHRVLFLSDGHIAADLAHPSLETILDQLADVAPVEGPADADATEEAAPVALVDPATAPATGPAATAPATAPAATAPATAPAATAPTPAAPTRDAHGATDGAGER